MFEYHWLFSTPGATSLFDVIIIRQEKTFCQTSTVYKMDFDKIGKSYSFSFDLYPKGDAKSEDDIALYIKVIVCKQVNISNSKSNNKQIQSPKQK